jgi:hypothetical protein
MHSKGNEPMTNRIAATIFSGCLSMQLLVSPASAENQMGYTLLPAAQAAQLSRGGGVLGLDVGRAQQISDSGMTFELLKVNSVRRGSPGETAGLKVGDQIIAVNGRVFPSVAAFASYVGSKQPGERITIDTMPAGGGPRDAQRVTVVLGSSRQVVQTQPTAPAATGLSTGTKVAIGIGAAALFGCYEFGCFSHRKMPTPDPAPQ